MKNRLKAKIKRKYRQRTRMHGMYILCKAYEMYHMMQLHAACTRESLTYGQAEEFSRFMNSIFSAKTTAETFLVDADEEANKSLEFYDNLMRVLNPLGERKRASILAFCKSVYFGRDCIGLRVEGFMYYPFYLEALLRYMDGMHTFNEMRGYIIDFKPWYSRPKKVDSRKFRHDFIEIERHYSSIVFKRSIRERKKIA